jgi:hypothetical protein
LRFSLEGSRPMTHSVKPGFTLPLALSALLAAYPLAHAQAPATSPTFPAAPPANTPGSMPRAGAADGTPFNPPSTATGRAVDGAAGRTSIPDGAPGNPPGTAAGRALDRATGATATPDQAGGRVPGATTAGTGLAPTPGSFMLERPRVSQLIGADVYNERNERVGEVDDVVLSGGTEVPGPVAVVQVGGFLGMGGRLVAVPLSELRWQSERSRVMLPGATRDMLEARPAFEYASLRGR